MSSTTFSTDLLQIVIKFTLYYGFPVYILGILGNLMNIVVFRGRRLFSNPCSQYFIAISISQLIFFNSILLTRLITFSNGYDLGRTNNILCKLRNYIFTFALGLTRQFLCLISIDRWWASKQNALLRQFSSKRTIRCLIIISTLFWILYSIHILIGYYASPIHVCSLLLNPNYAYFHGIQIIVCALTPFIIMLVFSLLTAHSIRKGHRRIAQTNTSTGISHRRYEIQLIKISLLQVFVYLILSVLPTAYPLYSVITSSQVRSVDQLAIDTLLNNLSLLSMYTYSAVCLKFCFFCLLIF